MKVSIVYFSESGNTKRVAEYMKETAESIAGIDAKIIDINNLDSQFMDESKVVIFGCPTYCGTMAWQLKKYFDTTTNKLAGKMGCAFATENYIGGGADLAELTIIGCMLVRGMIVYSGGTAEKPYTHFGAVTIKAGDELQVERVNKYILKIIKKAKEIFPE